VRRYHSLDRREYAHKKINERGLRLLTWYSAWLMAHLSLFHL
jgi:hypothetical protein